MRIRSSGNFCASRQLVINFVIVATLIGCYKLSVPQSKLEQIKERGVLQVLTRFDPTTYYKTPEGYAGFEYDLVNLFADYLGVKAEFKIPDTFDDILRRISRGKADLAAAGITVTELRQKKIRFAPPYHEITEQVVYRSGNRRPKATADLANGIVEVAKGTSHIDTLQHLQQHTPALTWNVNTELDTDGLLYLVNEGLIDYTIADSNQTALIRRFYPKLNIAYSISAVRQLAWALPLSKDRSLYNEVLRFFARIKKDKTLPQLIEKHYGHASSLSYVDNCLFRQHQKSRLPLYQKYFYNTAQRYKIDWRLLAAIGYQESHWLPRAVSPTGVEGIMMLTNDTAELLGIKNRTNPGESIDGGARYFKRRIELISGEVAEPDRTWFALASYNVGLGHLEDARELTKAQGGDPDKWLDVKSRLPLLSDERWFKNTKYGYARGQEPVDYVENIRSYYDLLVWLTEENQTQKNVMNTQTKPLKPKALVTEPLAF